MGTMWNRQAETASADERAGLQARRLRALVTRLLDESPFYLERLTAAGVGAGDETGLEQLAALSFTVKQDLWEGYPGRVLAGGPRPVGGGLRPCAGLRRRRAGHGDARGLRVRALHRRSRAARRRGAAGLHGGAGLLGP